MEEKLKELEEKVDLLASAVSLLILDSKEQDEINMKFTEILLGGEVDV